MAVVDPRLEMARRARLAAAAGAGTPRVVSLGDVMKRGMPAPVSSGGVAPQFNQVKNQALSFSDAQRRYQAMNIATGQQKKADQGLLADILGNSVVRTILKPLEVLDVPRRVVISGIHEIADAIGSGDASWDDFTDQVKDPTFGVGKFVDTGNKWVDRALGFFGDVALDPLTYVTFGASKFAGASGRLALSSQVLKHTGDDALAAATARFGRAALDGSQLAELAPKIKGLKPAGVYFMGKKVGGKSSGLGTLSSAVGSAGEKTLNRMRLAASDSRLVRFTQSAFTADVNREARLMLLRGEAPVGQAGQLIRIVNSRNSQRSAAGVAFTESQVTLAQAVRETGVDTNEALRKRVTQVLEGAAPTNDVEARAAARFRAWMDDLFKKAEGSMQAVDQTATFGNINGHVPWVMTEAGRKEMGRPTSRFLGSLKKGFDDGDVLSAFTPRYLFHKIREDGQVDWFGTTLTKEMLDKGEVNIDLLNRVARDAGFADDVFETDIVKIASSYAAQYSEQVGLATRYKELLDGGVFARREVVFNESDELWDPDAVQRQIAMVKSAMDDQIGAHSELSGALQRAVAAASSTAKEMEERLALAVSQTAEETATNRLLVAQQTLASLTEPINKALSSLRTRTASMIDLTSEPSVGVVLLGDLVEDMSKELDEQLALLQRRMETYATADEAVASVGREIEQFSQAAARMDEKLEKVTSQLKSAVEMGDLIQSRWSDLAAGKSFHAGKELSKTQAETLNKVSKALGFTVGRDADVMAGKGRFRDWLKATTLEKKVDGKVVSSRPGWQQHPLWNMVKGEGDSALQTSELAALGVKDIDEAIEKAMVGGSQSLHQSRVAGAWLLARDAIMREGQDTPEWMASAEANLVAAMQRAADAERATRDIGKIVSSSRRDIAVGSVELESVRRLERANRSLTLDEAFVAAWRSGDWDPSAAEDVLMSAGLLPADTAKADELLDRLYKRGEDLDDLEAGVAKIEARIEERLQEPHTVFVPDKGVDETLTMQEWRWRGEADGTFSRELRDEGYGTIGGVDNRTRRGLAEGLATQNSGLNATPDEVARELAAAVETYRLTSEFSSRWSAAAKEMAMLGVVPSEQMMREMFNASAASAANRWRAQMRLVDDATVAVNNIYSTWAAILDDIEYTGTPGEALSRAFEETYAKLDPSVVNMVDKLTLKFGDPEQMLKKLEYRYWRDAEAAQAGEYLAPPPRPRPGEKLDDYVARVKDEAGFDLPKSKTVKGADGKESIVRETPQAWYKRNMEARGTPTRKTRKQFRDEYYEEVVKPWFQQNYPGRAGVDKAKQALKERAALAQTKSPFRRDAARWEIDEFFANLRGGQVKTRVNSKAATRGKYNQQITEAANTQLDTVLGALNEEWRHSRKMSEVFALAADPNVDVDQFLWGLRQGNLDKLGTSQRTPSTYATSLRRLANELDRSEATLVKKVESRGKAQAQRIEADLTNTAQTAALNIATAKPRSSYEGIPDFLTKEAANQMRKINDRISRIKNGMAYTVALEEERRMLAVRNLAEFDGWTAGADTGVGRVDGFVVGAQNELSPLETPFGVRNEGHWGAREDVAYSPNVAKMPDGSPLVFSRSEYEALFVSDEVAAAELMRTRSRLGVLARKREAQEVRLRELTAAQKNWQFGGWGDVLGGRQLTPPEIARQIRIEKRRLESIMAEYDDALAMAGAYNPATRAMAQDKLDYLIEQFPEIAGRSGDMSQSATVSLERTFQRKASPSTAKRRAESLDAAWESSDSGQVLAEMSALEQAAVEVGLRDLQKNTAAAVETARRLRDKATRAELAVQEQAEGVAAFPIPYRDNFNTIGVPGSARRETLREVAGRVDTAKGATAQLADNAVGSRGGELPGVGVASAEMRAAADSLDQLRGPLDNLVGPDPALEQAVGGVQKSANFARRQLDEATDQRRSLVEERGLQSDLVGAQSEVVGRLQADINTVNNFLRGKDVQGEVVNRVGKDGKVVRGPVKLPNAEEAVQMWDSAKGFALWAEDVRTRAIPELEKATKTLRDFVDATPKLGKKKLDVPQARQILADLRRAADGLDLDPNDPMALALAQATAAEAKFLTMADNVDMANDVLSQLKQPQKMLKVSRMVSDGFDDLDAIGLPGLQATPEVKKIVSNMQRMEDPKFAKLVNGLIGSYTSFFKGYATLSPGFHIRNAMSNTFMLLASGANPKYLKRGLNLYGDMTRAMKAGKTFDQWVASLEGRVSADVRAAAEVAGRATFGAGGGLTDDQLGGLLARGKSKVTNNAALRLSAKAGRKVEGSARFMLAFDAGMEGMDLDGAMARVKRYLFDYQDISAADKNVKSIVPFWIWMSRNLPLQIVNQWAQPRTYAIYNSLMRNIGQDRDENDIVPSWLDERDATKIGDDLFLAPDFGFSRVSEQVAELGDIGRMASYVNPGLRVPFEVMGNRQWYNDVPFSDKPQEVALGPLSGPIGGLAQMLGMAETTADGQTVVDPRFNYMLRNLLPPLAQSERLLPSSEFGQEKQGNAMLNYLGIPIQQVTPGMKKGELLRRQREIEALRRSAENLGYTP